MRWCGSPGGLVTWVMRETWSRGRHLALWQSGVRAALGTRDRQLVVKFTCKDVNPILSDTMRHIYEFVVA